MQPTKEQLAKLTPEEQAEYSQLSAQSPQYDINKLTPEEQAEYAQLSKQKPEDNFIEEQRKKLAESDKIEAEYGGIGGQTISALAGAAKGLTLGLSDQALIKSGLVKKETLDGYYKTNPTSETLGEIVGAVAPAIFSGGTSVAAKAGLEGAKAVGKKGIVANALKYTPSAIVDDVALKIGSKAGTLAKSLSTGKKLSKTTTDIVNTAMKLGAGSAIEGAAYGVGDLISEDALGNAEFNAENVISALGSGAALGAATGGVLGVLGSSGNKVFKYTNDKISDLAKEGDIGVLKNFGFMKKDFKKLAKTASLDEKDLVDYSLALTGKIDPEDIVAKGKLDIKDVPFKQQLFAKVDDIIENNNKVKEASGRLMSEAIDGIDEKYLTLKASNNVPESLVLTKSDIAKKLEDKFLKGNEFIDDPRLDKIKEMVKDLNAKSSYTDPLTGERIFQYYSPRELKKQSMAYADLSKFGKNPSTAGLEDVYKYLWKETEGLLEKQMDVMGVAKDSLSRYKEGKKLYQKYKFLNDSLEDKIAKESSNNRFMGMTEGISGGIGGVIGTAAGGGIGGLVGAGLGLGARKLQREYGDIALSAVLRKIELNSNKGKKDISGIVDRFMKNTSKSINAARDLQFQNSEKDLEKAQEKYNNLQVNQDNIINNFIDSNKEIYDNAPKTASHMQNILSKSIRFLTEKMPKSGQDDIFDKRKLSRAELIKFKNYTDAIENPRLVLDRISQGYINAEYMEVLKNIYPKTYEAVVNEIQDRLPEFKKNMPESQKTKIQQLMGINVKPLMKPQNFAVLQGKMPVDNKKNAVPVTAATSIDFSGRESTNTDSIVNRRS